jgi:hypothetical protein
MVNCLSLKLESSHEVFLELVARELSAQIHALSKVQVRI